MKFISGIKRQELSSEIDIKIPLYHRSAISFFNGSEVYYIHRTFTSNGVRVRELILTPIIPDSWHHIRKLTITSIDSPGIINAITSKLRDLKINVNIEEALTTQIGAIHTISLIIDLTYYVHANKFNTGDKVPAEAIEIIENELNSIQNPLTGELITSNGRTSVKELTFLESISNVPSNFEISKISDVQFRGCINQKITNSNGKIRLNKKIINEMNLNESNLFYYTMFSDTEEKYLKILFFDPNQTVAFIDVHHQDVYGAIAKFTEIIFKGYNFNILASYSHQQMQKETAHWYALIDISQKHQEFFKETLAALKTAKYGDDGAQKKVLDVFLIETNIDSIPNDVIVGYGQNRPTIDGDLTSVYSKKKQLLTKYVEEFGVELYKKSPKDFINKHTLHNASSVLKLIDSIIAEKRKEKATMKRKYIILGISFLIPVAILSILVTLIPNVKSLVLDSIHHSQAVIITLSAIALMFFIHGFLEKNIGRPSAH